MVPKQFSPPAHLKDYDSIPNQREAWSAMISNSFDSAVACIEDSSKCSFQRSGPGVGVGNSQFYNLIVSNTRFDGHMLKGD